MDVLGGEEGREGGEIPEQTFQDPGDDGEDAGKYQQSHVEFVSSGKGTTPQEILLIGLPIHASLLLLTSSLLLLISSLLLLSSFFASLSLFLLYSFSPLFLLFTSSLPALFS